jgi:hypothetical protein
MPDKAKAKQYNYKEAPRKSLPAAFPLLSHGRGCASALGAEDSDEEFRQQDTRLRDTLTPIPRSS